MPDQDSTVRALLDECHIMMRGLLALFRKNTNVQRLIDADHALELSRNIQLRDSPAERQQLHQQGYAAILSERLRLLRTHLLSSFVVLASAVALAVLVTALPLSLSAQWRAWMGAASLFCFAWATLARLGWAGQSFKGDTAVERLDQRIFKFLYWLGTFVGVLALV